MAISAARELPESSLFSCCVNGRSVANQTRTSGTHGLHFSLHPVCVRIKFTVGQEQTFIFDKANKLVSLNWYQCSIQVYQPISTRFLNPFNCFRTLLIFSLLSDLSPEDCWLWSDGPLSSMTVDLPCNCISETALPIALSNQGLCTVTKKQVFRILLQRNCKIPNFRPNISWTQQWVWNLEKKNLNSNIFSTVLTKQQRHQFEQHSTRTHTRLSQLTHEARHTSLLPVYRRRAETCAVHRIYPTRFPATSSSKTCDRRINRSTICWACFLLFQLQNPLRSDVDLHLDLPLCRWCVHNTRMRASSLWQFAETSGEGNLSTSDSSCSASGFWQPRTGTAVAGWMDDLGLDLRKA